MKTGWTRWFGAVPEAETLQAAYRFALSLSRNPHDAEDLVQEACLKLCRRYGRIKTPSLMYTTIRHLFYDQYRRPQGAGRQEPLRLDSSQGPDSLFSSG